MNSNIFNISNEYLSIIATLEDNEGELTPELGEALAINEHDRDKKMEAYAYVISQKAADISLAKDEINRLKKLIKRDGNIVDRLKNVLINTMDLFGLTNKNGNLSHNLENHSMYTRKTKTIDILIDEFTLDDEEKFADFLDFSIKTKLTKEQLQKIMFVLGEEGNSFIGLDYDVNVSKTKIKDAVTETSTITDKSEFDNRIELIGELAQYRTITSLTIR